MDISSATISKRKYVAVLFCHQFRIKIDKAKKKIYHKTRDKNSISDPESAVIISTQQQGTTLELRADMELICILLS